MLFKTAAQQLLLQDSKPVKEQSPVAVGKDGDLSIAIQVKPGAKQDAVTG